MRRQLVKITGRKGDQDCAADHRPDLALHSAPHSTACYELLRQEPGEFFHLLIILRVRTRIRFQIVHHSFGKILDPVVENPCLKDERSQVLVAHLSPALGHRHGQTKGATSLIKRDRQPGAAVRGKLHSKTILEGIIKICRRGVLAECQGHGITGGCRMILQKPFKQVDGTFR